MLKVRILSEDFHTFEPYRRAKADLETVGIRLVDEDDSSYDLSLIGSSIFQDKKLGSFEASLQKGMDALREIKGPYILADGQDSSSVIGAYEVFKESDALALLKDTLLKDRELYKTPTVGGRYYWGSSEQWGVKGQNYAPEDWDAHKDRIFLSGKNWLSVMSYNLSIDYLKFPKFFDLSLMFNYPHEECHEFDLQPSQDYYYNCYRERIFNKTSSSPFMIAKLYKGRRLSPPLWEAYQQISKVILSPFGYGEYGAPRDLLAVALGSILLKENLDFLETVPHIYVANETYIDLKNDFSDLEEKIEYCVVNFEELRPHLIEEMKKRYKAEYAPGEFARYTASLFHKIGVL